MSPPTPAQTESRHLSDILRAGEAAYQARKVAAATRSYPCSNYEFTPETTSDWENLRDTYMTGPIPSDSTPAERAEILKGLGLNLLGADAPGHKDDQDKPRMDLIAPELMEALGQVLAYGAAKYAPRNWEKGMDWGRPYAALQRHMNAWWGGEDQDPETGMSHLAHAACNVMFLLAFEARGAGTDTRFKPRG